MDSESSVKITYETLFEILMREKNREELQRLDEEFIDNVVRYLNKKSEFLHKNKQGLSSFIEQGNESILSEIHNIQKIIKEIYNRRERKIVDMAINLAKSPKMLIDTSNCLKNEFELLETLKNILSEHRNEVLIEGILQNNKETEKQESKETNKKYEEPKDLKTASSSQDENTSEEESKNGLKSVVFLKDVPEILDSELNNYGPFNEGDIAELPNELVQLLSGQESIKLKE